MKKPAKIIVTLEKERIVELFDDLEIKFSEVKYKKLIKAIDDVELDIMERLENEFIESISEILEEEFIDE